MSTQLTTLTPARYDDKFDLVFKWAKDERDESDPDRFQLPPYLDEQRKRWNLIYGLLSTGKYARTTEQIATVKATFPGISDRTARNLLSDTKRFFAVLDAPNLAWERVALIEEIRDDIIKAKAKGDYRSVATLRTLYAKLIGADEPEETIENKTIFNIVAFNPEQLGVKLIDPEKLDSMIKGLLAADKKKENDFLTQFDDVTEEKH